MNARHTHLSLVAEHENQAAERERMIADGWRQCAVGQRSTQYCGMVAAERERCAKLCDEIGATMTAQAIREGA